MDEFYWFVMAPDESAVAEFTAYLSPAAPADINITMTADAITMHCDDPELSSEPCPEASAIELTVDVIEDPSPWTSGIPDDIFPDVDTGE